MPLRVTTSANCRFGRILFVGILVGILSRESAYSQTLPTADVIKKAVRSYDSSIRQMKGKYQSRIMKTSQFKRSPEHPLYEDEVDDVTFIADIERGRTRLDKMRDWKFSWFDNNEHFVIREISTFDGNLPQTLIHTFAKSPVPIEIPRDVPMRLNINSENSVDVTIGPWSFSGVRILHIPNDGFADVFEQGFHVDREEAMDGHNCIVVTCQASARVFRMWLDPTIDYLPRKFIIAHLDGASLWTYSIYEFTQFDDGAGNKRWFPTKGSAESQHLKLIYEYQLVEFELNVEVQDSDFIIDQTLLPPGVCVFDGGNVSYTGGREDLYVELKKLSAEQDRLIDERYDAVFPPDTLPKTSAVQPAVSVMPSDTNWIRIAGFVCVMTLVLALIVRRLSFVFRTVEERDADH